MIETAAEREALTSLWGDVLHAGSARVRGQFDEPQAEDLLIEGTAPVFMASRAEFAAAGVTLNSTVDSVTTYDGRTRGPFLVTRWQSEEDGAFVTVALQQQ